MPIETQDAINWALQEMPEGHEFYEIVDKVREYFNVNSIVYNTFSYDDLRPFLGVE